MTLVVLFGMIIRCLRLTTDQDKVLHLAVIEISTTRVKTYTTSENVQTGHYHPTSPPRYGSTVIPVSPLIFFITCRSRFQTSNEATASRAATM